jgi:hypothetical protein
MMRLHKKPRNARPGRLITDNFSQYRNWRENLGHGSGLKNSLFFSKKTRNKDLDCYLGEFKSAHECFVMMKVPYSESDMVHQIIRGLPTTGSWPHFWRSYHSTAFNHWLPLVTSGDHWPTTGLVRNAKYNRQLIRLLNNTSWNQWLTSGYYGSE